MSETTDTAARTARETGRPARGPGPTADPATARNEVLIAGRLGAAAEERLLPSGDPIVTLRVIVPRSPRARHARDAPSRVTVDTIDVVCWTTSTRRAALRLPAGGLVEVSGALRRRFFGGPGGRQSRYEVEASAIRRVRGGPVPGT
ncbi:single-stranded DNA-binding protein [Intrasporangium oryzae NRRL B-24470]|uniref:Single-stranded DNA-binding protein n=1 Tax=Intrasporangium oryzae NRRL B-24470 TaxID=1386089 RepID=W9G7Q9_9MICO|nr:single-stranded DNA-binding protein [Intrasporangium oryzae]EWT00858.1 single-stranded DNA-binding protein [Intrasporangium oryzae NRRL B-24470]